VEATEIERAERAGAARHRGAQPWSLRSVLRALGLEPLARLLAWAAATAADRALWLLLAPFSSRRARERRRAEHAARATARAVATLGALKGVFVKAGQFAAHRHDLLPGATTSALAALRDRVPPLPLRTVRRAVEAQLGAPLEALFEHFDPDPVAAASVAQVHLARLPGGEAVAVKVQYPWLEAALPADLAIARGLLAVFARPGRRSGIDRSRLFDEFASGLREELDFEREAAVAAEIRANLADDERIVVPRIFPSHSGRRVLTMAYHPAVPIDDREGLHRLGASPRAVLEIVARAYCKQVFEDGLFHADPHPGNLFVLDEPEAAERPRVLFVDFGLSRRLAPRLRREMQLAIFALIRRDADAFVAGMDRLGMIAPGAHAGVRAAVAVMLSRIGERGGALGVSGSSVLSLKDEARTLLEETPGVQIPHDLLLFAKTLSYVFALAPRLDPEADLMRLALPYLLRFLAARGADPAGG
jgi:predicted unusual protein kinase regulating ubiquinone biosynthesis (AarF/ABC1/UbiB family)